MDGRFPLALASALLINGAVWAQTNVRTPSEGGAAVGGQGAMEEAVVDSANGSNAETAPPSVNPDGQFITRPTADQMRTEEIIGKEVVNAAGDQIGSVSDIILDKSGKITGIVIKSGGVFGIGGKKVAISTTNLPDMSGATVLLAGFTQDQLLRAPEFESVDKDRPQIDSGNTAQTPE